MHSGGSHRKTDDPNDQRRETGIGNEQKYFYYRNGNGCWKNVCDGIDREKLREAVADGLHYKAAMSGNERAGWQPDPGTRSGKNMSGIRQSLEEMCPYVYETAVSAPGIRINPVQMETVLAGFQKVCEEYEYVTMEGSGGILCPLCFDETDIRLPEVVKACGLGCLMIADAGLGTINGVALTAYYLKEQGIPLKGIIFNHYKQGDVLHEDNRKMCEYYTGVPVVACVADGDTELSMDAEDLKALYETAEK